jgi:hypothetical protein
LFKKIPSKNYHRINVLKITKKNHTLFMLAGIATQGAEHRYFVRGIHALFRACTMLGA